MTHLLKAENLSKNFGGLKAVQNLNLHVNPAEIVSLIGPNGAGKTTVFNLLSGVLKPSTGAVFFDGRDMKNERTQNYAKLGMARTFQNLALFKHSTVVENLLVGMHTHIQSNPFQSIVFAGRARAEEARARKRVEEIIDFLEMAHIRNHIVGALSYGQQKRVELGRALACQPKMLLLDEIVAGMNQEETEDIARFILDIRDEFRTTILMIEHDMQVVMDLSDRVYVLEFGGLISEGSPQDVSSDPAVLRAYLGDEEALHV